MRKKQQDNLVADAKIVGPDWGCPNKRPERPEETGRGRELEVPDVYCLPTMCPAGCSLHLPSSATKTEKGLGSPCWSTTSYDFNCEGQWTGCVSCRGSWG